MNNILTNIGEALLAVNFVALLFILSLKQKKTAFEVVVFTSVILGVLHLAIEYWLAGLKEQGGDIWFIRAAWYLGFSSTYLIHVIACSAYCGFKGLIRDKSSNIILLCFFIASIVQVLRYIDRFILETDLLRFVYTSGIPALNSICTIVVLLYVISKFAERNSKKLNSYVFIKPIVRKLTQWTA